MSKLSELIQQYATDGVKFVQLGDVCVSTSNIRWQNTDRDYRYIDLTSVSRETHTITETAIINAEEAPSRAQKLVEKDDVIFATTRPTLQRFTMIDDEYDGEVASTGYCVLRADKAKVLPRWIYHCIGSTEFNNYVEKNQEGSAYPAISDSKVKDFPIPLPPLPIQNEIVRILDNFTELTAELTTELAAELAARKKQYEYYRDFLLTFEEPASPSLIGRQVRWVKLGDMAQIGTGSSNSNEGLEQGLYPFFVRSQEVRFMDSYEFDETAIITAGDGVGVGKVFHYVQGKYALHQRAYRIKIVANDLNPKFFFYYMKSDFAEYIKSTAVHTSVTSVRKPMLDNYPVPLPPLTEQARIVAILDRFDALTNDLTAGLPAEIAARKRQYEYYRDKLLNFEEAAS